MHSTPAWLKLPLVSGGHSLCANKHLAVQQRTPAATLPNEARQVGADAAAAQRGCGARQARPPHPAPAAVSNVGDRPPEDAQLATPQRLAFGAGAGAQALPARPQVAGRREEAGLHMRQRARQGRPHTCARAAAACTAQPSAAQRSTADIPHGLAEVGRHVVQGGRKVDDGAAAEHRREALALQQAPQRQLSIVVHMGACKGVWGRRADGCRPLCRLCGAVAGTSSTPTCCLLAAPSCSPGTEGTSAKRAQLKSWPDSQRSRASFSPSLSRPPRVACTGGRVVVGGTAQHSTAQHGLARHRPAGHSMPWHTPAQHAPTRNQPTLGQTRTSGGSPPPPRAPPWAAAGSPGGSRERRDVSPGAAGWETRGHPPPPTDSHAFLFCYTATQHERCQVRTWQHTTSITLLDSARTTRRQRERGRV